MEIIKKYLQKSQNLLNQLRDYKYNKFRPKANKAISELFNNKLSSPKDDKYIICEALWDNPHHWLRLAIFGPLLSNYLSSRFLGLYEKGTSRKIVKTLKAFKLDKYLEINPKIKGRHLLSGKQYAKVLRDSGNIFNFKLPYDFPWQFLYDSMLKSEMIGSIDPKNKKIPFYIAKLISYLEEYETKIDWQRVAALIISHPVNFRFSTLTHIALSKGIPVYILNYVNEYIAIRKLESLDDWEAGSYEKPDYSIVSNLPSNKKDFLEEIGREYLNQVRSAKKGEVSTIGTFKNDSPESFDKKEFFKNLDLDRNKPTVVIMTGCWPDFPNLYAPSWYIDYVDWFKKTLEIIKDLDNANWIIKPHPAEFKYGSKTKIEHFLKNINSKKIITWPEIVSSDKLLRIADVVVTSHGSAGFEYPALGKPAICTRKTHYANWGFTNLCSEFSEYKNLLENIQMVKKPDKNAQKLAYIYIASFFCNASVTSGEYLFGMGSKSNKLWPTIENFINKNNNGIRKEQLMMEKWLRSNIQSYNFFKSINYDLWHKI